MCQSKQLVLIAIIFGICIAAAVGLTVAYFHFWHYKGNHHQHPPIYHMVMNTQNLSGNGTRKPNKNVNAGILRLHGGIRATTVLSNIEQNSTELYWTEIHSDIALIIGGEGSNKVEIFAPENSDCHGTQLSPIPTGQILNPVVAYLQGEIFTCDSQQCWIYSIRDKEWKIRVKLPSYSSSIFSVGLVNEGRLFILRGDSLVAYEPKTGGWTHLQNLPKDPGIGSCLITTNNTLYVLGGSLTPKTVQRFNLSSQKWIEHGSKSPIDVIYSGCTLLDERSIAVLGSQSSRYRASYTVYDLDRNDWQKVGRTNKDRSGSSLVKLNQNLFAVGGGSPERAATVDEFEDGSWTETKYKLNATPYMHSILKIPSYLFTCRK